MSHVSKIKLGENVYDVKDASAARKNVYYGTCTTAANTYKKVATVETFPLDESGKPLVGTVVAIKYSNSNSYKTEGYTYLLNVNSTGDYPMYYNNAELATSTSANTLVAGYKNRNVFYMFNGTLWVWLTASYDANTTYSGMTQAEVDAGTGTTARLITPQRLRDNFYTEGEVDTLLAAKAAYEDLSGYAPLRTDDMVDYAYMPHFVLDGINKTIPSNPYAAGWSVAHTTDNQIAVRYQEVNGLEINTGYNYYTPSQYVIYFNKEDYKFYRWTGSAMVAISSTVAYTGSYNDLTDKPTIPAAITVDSTITQNGTNPVQGGAIYSALSGKANKNGSADEPFNISTLQVCSNSEGIMFYSDITENSKTISITDSVDGTCLTYSFDDSGETKTIATTDDLAALTASDVGALPSNTHIPNDIKVGSVAGKLYRNNVGGSGNFSISGNSGCIPNLTAGTFLVSVYAKSDTQSYTFRFNFGSVTYDLSTTSGEINDIRQITIPSSGTFSGSVLNGSVASGTILYVVMYNYLTPVSTVGIVAVTNRYSDLDGTPTIPTKVSDLTNDSGYITGYTETDPVFIASAAHGISSADISSWDAKADPVTIVTVSTTGAVTQALDPNKFYDFTGSPTSLTLTLTSGTGLCIYAGKFTAGTGFSNLSLPASVKEADGIPSIEAGNTYEFSIMDNLLLLVKEGS